RSGRFTFGTWRNGQRRASETNDVVALTILTSGNSVAVVLVGNPGRYEVVLQPGNPATLYGFLDRTLVDVFHRHLFVGFRRCPQSGTQVSRSTGSGGRRWIGTVIALELREHIAGPGLSALVVDHVADNQVIQAALEGKALDVIDA